MNYIKKLAVLLTLLVPSFAFSQGFSNPGDATKDTENYTSQELLSFSKKVEKKIASEGAIVAIVSRVGRPPSELPEGVTYTHVAFWVYSDIKTKDGKDLKGYQVYNLYQKNDKPNVSDLVNDFPVDFFAGTYELKSGIIIPKKSLQMKLFNVINSKTYSELHNKNYSVVAKVDSSQYQNCTSFVLKVLFSALYDTNSIPQINANINKYFTPQVIKIGPLKKLLGGMFVSDFYPNEHDGEIKTATFNTIKNFMQKYNLTTHVYTVTGESQ